MTIRSLVVGGSGFIGSQILSSLQNAGHRVTGTSRNPPLDSGLVQLDLRNPESLFAILENIDFAFLSAPYLGSDESTGQEINVQGVQNFVDVARDTNIHCIFYLSTTSVYGSGPFYNSKVGETQTNPASWRSFQRLLAEEIVLDAGGLVLRTNLVTGPNEQWFTQSLRHLIGEIGGVPMSMTTAKISLIDSHSLGNACANLVQVIDTFQSKRILHAVTPTPLTALEIAYLNAPDRDMSLRNTILSDEIARSYALSQGFSSHQIDMFMLDNWFDPEEFARLLN